MSTPGAARAKDEALLVQIQDLFRDVLDQPALVLTRESNGQTIEGWDSLTHVLLTAAIGRRYGVKFALGEMKNLQNVGDLLGELERRLVAK